MTIYKISRPQFLVTAILLVILILALAHIAELRRENAELQQKNIALRGLIVNELATARRKAREVEEQINRLQTYLETGEMPGMPAKGGRHVY